MLEAPGRVGRLVFEIKVDAGSGKARQVDPDEMRIGGAVEISFNQPHGVGDPIAVDRRAPAVAGLGAGRRSPAESSSAGAGDRRAHLGAAVRPVHAVAHGVEDVSADVVGFFR